MSEQKRRLPIGQQTLPDIINENFIYVDKTRTIHELIIGKRYFFLSRPRRFGKTLLVSTLQEIFLGNRDLFKSLYIESTDYSWEKYPVITISFATLTTTSAILLRQAIEDMLTALARQYDIELDQAVLLGMRFKSLILKLAVHNKVVILIDEYDAAILKNLEDFKVADACREVLSEFFSALKDIEVDKHLRFVFITGISKFSKTSIFSGLNHLQDLSLDRRAAKLLGYTFDEIKANYQDYLEDISKESGASVEEILEQIRFWYNGYQFVNPAAVPDAKVYNPYSVMLYLQNKVFDNYWFDTGTPSFLMRLIKSEDYPVPSIEGSEIHLDETKSYEIENIELIPLLLQAGYVTIESYDPQTKNFAVTFPNEEVRLSFFKIVLLALTKTKQSQLASLLVKLNKALEKADFERLLTTIQIYFSQFPYTLHVSSERHYQSIFFGLLTLIGADVKAEEPTNDGRIDAVIETKTHIVIIEFKLNDSAAAALAQIENKKYYQKYLLKGKTIVLIGVQFDIDKRNITQWVIKEIDHKSA